jgi:Uma2 family endonuclease
VTPPPRLGHQRVVVELVRLLVSYVEAVGLTLFVAPTGVRASRKTQVEPDLFVVDSSVLIDHRALFLRMPGLQLAVEILSPSTSSVDRGKKRALYLAQGIPEYWIVDVDARTVDIWTAGRADARRETKFLAWQPVAGRGASKIDLGAVFREVRENA